MLDSLAYWLKYKRYWLLMFGLYLHFLFDQTHMERTA